MVRYRDDGEVQIDNSMKVRFRNAFQWLILIAELNVGTLLTYFKKEIELNAKLVKAANISAI